MCVIVKDLCRCHSLLENKVATEERRLQCPRSKQITNPYFCEKESKIKSEIHQVAFCNRPSFTLDEDKNGLVDIGPCPFKKRAVDAIKTNHEESSANSKVGKAPSVASEAAERSG